MSRSRVAWYIPLLGRGLMLFAIGMLAFTLFGAVAANGKEASLPPKIVTQPVISANATVQINHAAGRVRILPNTEREVRVEANSTARHLSRGLAEQSLREVQVELLPERDGVIRLNARPDDAWGFAFERDIDIVVRVPEGVTLDLTVQAGYATVERHSGRIVAKVQGGGLDLADVRLGDGSRVEVNAGHARLDGELVPDASLDVRVRAGNATLELPRTTDAYLDARAASGHLDIDTSEWTGLRSTISTRGGDVTAVQGPLYTTPNPKGKITIDVAAGNATLRPRSSAPTPPRAPNPPAPPPAPSR